MRHFKKGKKLGRTSSHRKAMLSNLATALLRHGRIKTTEAKSKELVRLTDRLITLAKRGDLHARRLVMRRILDKEIVRKLFEEVKSKFRNRNGGYTRVHRLNIRQGDGARMVIVELVE
jgi:large subunit ribosomal protein L17